MHMDVCMYDLCMEREKEREGERRGYYERVRKGAGDGRVDY